MKVKRQGDIFLITVDRGEEFVGSLIDFAVTERILTAEIHAIGALRNVQLGYFWVDRKEYKRRIFPENVELLSCTGNLAIREDKPFAHLHATAGFEDFTVVGGHLFSGDVSVTVEVILRPLPERIDRIFDEITGLYLLDLPLRKAF